MIFRIRKYIKINSMYPYECPTRGYTALIFISIAFLFIFNFFFASATDIIILK